MDNPLVLLLRGIQTVGLGPTWAGVAHAIRTRWVEAKFADPERPLRGLPLLAAFLRRIPVPPGAFPPPGPVTVTPGPLLSVQRGENSLHCRFAYALLIVRALAPDRIRVTWQASPFSPSAEGDEGEMNPPELHTDRLLCRVAADGRIAFLDLNGAVLAEEVAPVGWTADGRALLRWQFPPDAHFYGLGERAAPLDLRGGVYVNWNTDPRTYGPGDDPLYLCVPFLLTLPSEGQHASGLLLENSTRSRFDLGRTEPGVVRIEVEGPHPSRGWGEVSYLFFHAPTVAELVERFTEETGRHPLFPRWALGYHQCRWSYYPEARVRRLARDFRETYGVPCDGIHLDIHYMDGYRVFTWDPRRFPDPKGLIADLHAQGFKVITIIDPGVKADRNYWVFQDGLGGGGRSVGIRMVASLLGECGRATALFPTSPTRELPKNRGTCTGNSWRLVDGILDDMNEPALWRGREPFRTPSATIWTARGATTWWPAITSRAEDGPRHAEGLARLRPDRRP
ncbi:MAG: glycoside hydrolase family 31 protein, partial [Anaerolineae bacterium]|nr:glycoside hydrolase family 31 protein [Anaerolineae bacterium]